MRAPLPLVLALAGAVLVAGCTMPSLDGASGGAGARPMLAFTATEYNFTGPATAAPGWTTVELRNSGQQLHHMQMVNVGEHTMQEVMAAMQAQGPPPSWARFVGGPNAVSPGATVRVVMDLQAGNHVMVCFIPGPDGVPHVEHGMMAMLRVEGAPNGASPPAADATLDMTDYRFQASKPLAAGTHTVKVVNRGAEPHEAPLIKLEGNATWQQFTAAFGPNATGPPPGRGAGGYGTLPPGGEAYAIVTLSPGRYAWLCFESNAQGPHFMQGMAHEFTVA